MSSTRFLLLIAVSAAAALCQTDNPAEKPSSETGSLGISFTGGYSFGLPSVQAMASVSGVGTAVSPLKKTLPQYNMTASVRAWKFLVPFVDLTAIDTGKATATVGNFTSKAMADTYAVNGGVRFMGSRGRIRPFAQVGGGFLAQDLTSNFSQAGRSVDVSSKGSVKTVMFGAGFQVHATRRLGSFAGFDTFRLNNGVNNGGQMFTRTYAGFFVQTRSSLK